MGICTQWSECHRGFHRRRELFPNRFRLSPQLNSVPIFRMNAQSPNTRWAILGLITVSHVIGAMAQYGINTLAPFYKDELGLSRAQVGLFFSAFYLAMAGFSFGTGWLSDRFGVRRTMLHGHLALGV